MMISLRKAALILLPAVFAGCSDTSTGGGIVNPAVNISSYGSGFSNPNGPFVFKTTPGSSTIQLTGDSSNNGPLTITLHNGTNITSPSGTCTTVTSTAVQSNLTFTLNASAAGSCVVSLMGFDQGSPANYGNFVVTAQ